MLLLGGVLLIVVLAVVLLRGGLFQSSSQNVELSACKNSLAGSSACFDVNGDWVPTGEANVTIKCNQTLDGAGYPCTCPDSSNCYCECGPSPA